MCVYAAMTRMVWPSGGCSSCCPSFGLWSGRVPLRCYGAGANSDARPTCRRSWPNCTLPFNCSRPRRRSPSAYPNAVALQEEWRQGFSHVIFPTICCSDAAQTDSERDANGDLIERYSCRYVKIAFDALFRDMVLNSEVGSP